MKNRIPWLTLVLMVIVLIALFEPDITAGHWLQVGFKLAGLLLFCTGVWGFSLWRRQR